MKILKYFCLILFLIFFSRCDQFHSTSSPGDKLTNQLINRVSKKLAKNYNLTVSAVGGSVDELGIKSIILIYRHYGAALNVEKARIIMVNMIEEYLNEINNDEKLRTYLKNYPFTTSNLILSLISFNDDGETHVDPDLVTISIEKDYLSYQTKDPNNPYNYKDSFTEKYADALKIVRNSGELLLDKSNF